MKKKSQLHIVLLLALLYMVDALAIDLYLPAMPIIQKYFHSNIAHVALTINLFIISYAVIQLIIGPLSDRFGRRPILLGSLGLFIAASVGCALTPSIDFLIAMRIIQAFGACGSAVLVYAILRDLYSPQENAKMLSYISMTIAVVPLLAPTLGGYLTRWFGWRSNFIFLAVFGALLLVLCIPAIQETNKFKNPNATNVRVAGKNYFNIIKNPLFIYYMLCMVMSFAALFAFIASSPFLFISILKVPPKYFGLLFAANALCLISGNFITGKLTNFINITTIVFIGSIIMLSGGIIMFTAGVLVHLSIASLLIPMMISSFGIAMILPSATAGMLAPFGKESGTASALGGFLRFGIAAFLATLVTYFTSTTQLPLAITITICSSICLGSIVSRIKTR